jgi:hypothetical protein
LLVKEDTKWERGDEKYPLLVKEDTKWGRGDGITRRTLKPTPRVSQEVWHNIIVKAISTEQGAKVNSIKGI